MLILGLFIAATLSPAVPIMSIQQVSVTAQAGAAGDPYNTSAGPIFTLPQWTDGGGWSAEEYYSTIQLADVDGNGKDELLARGPNGMIVQSWDSTLGLWTSVSESGPFPDEGSWNKAEYYATIQLADVDGDGADELLGRSSAGMDTYKWSNSAWTKIATANPNWSDKAGWNKSEYYLTIQTADIDGDGAAELLARTAKGIDTYKWSGSEWSQVDSANPPWSDKNDWKKQRYYLTIQTGDIDGDGADELLGRGVEGMDSYDWNGSSWTLMMAKSPDLSDKAGWDKAEYYATIQTADIDGDGTDELLARSSKGLNTYRWSDSSWSTLKEASPAWDDKNGWNHARYYATIQPADINGDGADELLIRSAKGIDTWHWVGTEWGGLGSATPALSDDNWANAQNFMTIQNGDIDGDGADELVARGLYGVRTWSWNELTANAWDHPTAYGFTPFTGDQSTAAGYIATFLTIESGQTVRDQYDTDANTLLNYQDCLFNGGDDNQWADWTELPTETCEKLGDQTAITPPSGLTLDDWNAVAQQLFGELGLAQAVADYFSDLATLYSGIFTDNENILTSTAQTLYGDDMSNKKVDATFQSLFLAPFKLGPLGGPAVSAATATLSALISLGISAASSESFEGEWSDAQSKFTNLSEKNKDAIGEGQAFVAGDAGLLSYVAGQKTSGAWDPANDWVVRYTTSEGRKQFALWIFQTLSPSVWELNKVYFEKGSDCSRPNEKIHNYYIGENGKNDCYREIIDRSCCFPDFYKYAPGAQLKMIMHDVSNGCTPTMDNTASWEYGSCNLGVKKKEFFLNENGWNFKKVELCETCSSPHPPALDMLIGLPGNNISLSDPGHAHVVIFGSVDFDATKTIPGSLEFAGASPVGWWSDSDDWHPAKLQDRNGDGYIDVVAAFLVQDLELSPGDTRATLTGSTTAGYDFKFTTAVNVTASP